MIKTTSYSLFIIYTVLLIGATLAPQAVISKSPFNLWDKLIHFLSFGFWSGSYYLILLYLKGKTERESIQSALIWGAFFGGLIEVLQLILPINRSFEFADFLADVLGSLCFTFCFYWLNRTKKSALK